MIGRGRERSSPNLRYCLGFCINKVRKTTKCRDHDCHICGRYLSPRPSEYKKEIVQVFPQDHLQVCLHVGRRITFDSGLFDRCLMLQPWGVARSNKPKINTYFHFQPSLRNLCIPYTASACRTINNVSRPTEVTVMKDFDLKILNEKKSQFARFEFLNTVMLKIQVFWNASIFRVKQCNSILWPLKWIHYNSSQRRESLPNHIDITSLKTWTFETEFVKLFHKECKRVLRHKGWQLLIDWIACRLEELKCLSH